jgi:hypothetical protein
LKESHYRPEDKTSCQFSFFHRRYGYTNSRKFTNWIAAAIRSES